MAPDPTAFLDLIETTLDRRFGPDALSRRWLDLDLDSLDLATAQVALTDRFGEIEYLTTDGFVEPTWTLREWRHFVCASIDRGRPDGVQPSTRS